MSFWQLASWKGNMSFIKFPLKLTTVENIDKSMWFELLNVDVAKSLAQLLQSLAMTAEYSY